MKYAFSSISSVKNEAKRLKKKIEKVVPGLSGHANMYQDLSARFYGWQDFSEMLSHHEQQAATKSSDSDEKDSSVVVTGYCNNSVRLITTLSFCEKVALEENKRKLTGEFLARTIDSYGYRASLVNRIFTEETIFTKLRTLLGKKQKSLNCIGDLSYDTQRQHFAVYGESLDRQLRILHEFHIPKSIHNGGLFILEESVFNRVYPDALSVYSVTKTHAVVYDYVHGSGSLTSNSINVINSMYLHEARDMVASHIQDDEDVMERSGYFWDLYISHLIAVNQQIGNAEKTLAEVWGKRFANMNLFHDYREFIDTVILNDLYENCLRNYAGKHYEPINHRNREIINWVENCPMFDKHLFIGGHEQLPQFYEHVFYMLMGLFGAFEEINIDTEKEPISITEAIESKSVVFVVIPDSHNEVLNPAAKAILSVFRDIAVRKLGVALGETQTDTINPHRERAKAIYPIYLDNYTTYSLIGFEVICSHLRALSYSVWFNIKSEVIDSTTNEPMKAFGRKSHNHSMSSLVTKTFSASIDNSIYLDYQSFCKHIDDDLSRVSDKRLTVSRDSSEQNSITMYNRVVYSIQPKDYQKVSHNLKKDRLIYFSKATALEGASFVHSL
ncbi:hypothetical protein LMH73_020050 [Vibrio splendidus]|nr:hypothetical protein [Vibrio splendidus]MCC4880349.1 hypothetical protein [Vibrio splendidus]